MSRLLEWIKLLTISLPLAAILYILALFYFWIKSKIVKPQRVSYQPKQIKFKVTYPEERLEINDWHRYIHSQLK